MSDFYRVDDDQTVDADFINGFLGDINLRLRGLEAQRQDLDAAIQGVNDLRAGLANSDSSLSGFSA